MLYRYPYQPTVELFPIYKSKEYVSEDAFYLPGASEIENDFNITKNFSLSELVKASYILKSEVKEFEFLPIDTRVVQGAQLLRSALGSPISVTSSFRSEGHELKKGRDGTSQHVEGLALDLSAPGLVDLVKNAVLTKNKLYRDLLAIGVTAFGVYPDKNFVHIDVRQPKKSGKPYLWGFETVKKKETFNRLVLFIPLLIIGVVYLISKKLKK